MFQYVGGKNRMSTWLWEHRPDNFKTYVEVFGGAFWNYINNSNKPQFDNVDVYYNDYNPFATNVMVCSQDEQFYNLIKDRERDKKELYAKYREEIDQLEKDREAVINMIPDYDLAWKYIYVLSHSHSGIYHSNRFRPFSPILDKEGNVIEGGAGDKIRPIVNRLAKQQLRIAMSNVKQYTSKDFQEVIEQHDSPNTFFYADPPYYDKEYLYSFNEFGLKDHERVANVLKQINGQFLLSYYAFDQLVEWFPQDQFYWEEKEFVSSVNNNDSEKTLKRDWSNVEVLISNYPYKHRSSASLKSDVSLLEF